MAPAGRAQDTVILVDHSGSMAPYCQEGWTKRLTDQLLTAAGQNGGAQLAGFSQSTFPLSSTSAPEFCATSGATHLNSALASSLGSYGQIWLLTDNQLVEPGAQIQDFYSTLQSDRVQEYHVFPLVHTPGQPGLLVYAISTLPPYPNPRLAQQVAAFLDGASPEDKLADLVMKPLGENVIEVTVTGGDKLQAFEEGQVLKFKSMVQIGPKFNHLYFQPSRARGSTIANPFREQPCLKLERSESSISPEEVETVQPKVYEVTVDFGRVTLDSSRFSCIWHAAFGGRSHEVAEIQTPISIFVPRQHYRLSDRFLADFTAADPADAKKTGKIAYLAKLPDFLAPTETVVPVRVPHQVRVTYSSKWAFLLFALASGILAILTLGVRTIARAFSEAGPAVRAVEKNGSVLRAEVKQGSVLVSGHPVGRLAGKVFTPAPGIRLDPPASSASIQSPTPISLTLNDGSTVYLTFGRGSTSVVRPPGAPPAGKPASIKLTKR